MLKPVSAPFSFHRLLSLYRVLVPFKRKFWQTAVLIAFQSLWTVIIVGVMSAFAASLLQRFVGSEKPSSGLVAVFFDFFHQYGFLLSAIALGLSIAIDQLIQYLVYMRVLRLSLHSTQEIRNQIFEGFLQHSMRYYDNQKKGYLLQMLIVETESCQGIMLNMFRLSLAVFYALVSVVLMIALSWKMTVLVLGLGIGSFVMLLWASHHMRRYSKLNVQTNRDLTALVEESLSHIRFIKLFNLYEKVRQSFSEHSKHRNASVIKIQSYNEGKKVFFAFAALAVVVLVGIGTVEWKWMALSSFVPFFYLMNRLNANLGAFSSFFGELASDIPHSDKIVEFLLELQKNAKSLGEFTKPVLLKNEIHFENVSLAYDQGVEVLSGLSFKIKRGEMVALVGPSGAGKTSIASLLLRLYEPSGGQILIDGIDLKKYELSFLRSRIGVIPQEPVIFNASIRENLCLGRPNCTDEEIVRAAEKAYAHSFITELPEGYGTVVGDRGTKLSQGQKQRINIAQTILKDPEILILDEATSALDSQSESLVQESFRSYLGQKTMIVIAHRLSTVRSANRILVLKNGKLEEVGSWESLMDNKASFFQMVELQSFR